MKKQEKIENTFLDILCLILSFMLGFFRSVKNFFSGKKIQKNYAFDTLDFVFRTWPKYFWKSPSLYKILMFPADFICNTFDISPPSRTSTPPLTSKEKKNGFTLVEVMVSLLIIGIIIPVGFYAYSSAIASKAKIIQNTNIQQEALYFTERFFQMLKEGGNIDYEEYWNRKMIHAELWDYASWSFPDIFTINGHYEDDFTYNGPLYSGRNFWNNWPFIPRNDHFMSQKPWFFYICRSGNGNIYDSSNSEWCLLPGKAITHSQDYFLGSSWKFTQLVRSLGQALGFQNFFTQQIFWQYALQHIDYNSNADNDGGDEDWDGNLIWDADDAFLGIWPPAFSDNKVAELYLLSKDGKERTYFRWNFQQDDDAPNANCISSERSDIDTCRWTLEFTRLVWTDEWLDHDTLTPDAFQGDGKIDTWRIHPDFDKDTPVANSNNANWQPLFSENIDVTDFQIFLYPNKNRKYNWADTDSSTHVAPYARIVLKLRPSWKVRKNIRWSVPEFDFSTTVSLGGVLSER